MKSIIGLFLLPAFLFFGCQDDELPDIPCEKKVFIDSAWFVDQPNEYLSINNVYFRGDCLVVDYSFCGETSEGNLMLIDAEEEVDGFKHSRRLRFSFDVRTNCFAINSHIQTFDISALKKFHDEYLVLTIAGFGKTIYKF